MLRQKKALFFPVGMLSLTSVLGRYWAVFAPEAYLLSVFLMCVLLFLFPLMPTLSAVSPNVSEVSRDWNDMLSDLDLKLRGRWRKTEQNKQKHGHADQ